MRADLDDVAVVHDEDHVGVADGGKPVGDDKGSSSFHQVFHAFLDQDLGSCIDGRCGFVENQDLRIAEEGAGDGKQLFLPLGNVGRFFIDLCLIAVFQRADEVVDIGGIRRLHDFLVGGVHAAVADIVHDRAGMEPGILQNHAEAVTQVSPGHVRRLFAVDVDMTGIEFIETHQPLDDGRFAGAGRTDDGDLGTVMDIGTEIMDDCLFRIIAEDNVFKGDIALDLDIAVFVTDRDRMIRIRCFFRFFKEFEDAFGCCRSSLQNVHDLGCRGDRLIEVADILDERLNITDGKTPVDSQPAAQHTAADIADVADEIGDRLHGAGNELGFPGRRVKTVVQVVEGVDRTRFAIERLHDDVAAVHFLDMAVDVAERVLLGFEVFLGIHDDDGRRKSGKRHDDQRHQSQLPGDRQHHIEDADDRDQRGEYLLHGLVQ